MSLKPVQITCHAHEEGALGRLGSLPGCGPCGQVKSFCFHTSGLRLRKPLLMWTGLGLAFSLWLQHPPPPTSPFPSLGRDPRQTLSVTFAAF